MGKISLLFCFCILVAFGFVNANTAKENIGFYELKNGKVSAKFTNWGATLVSFVLPNKNGKLIDVVLGYDSIEEYQKDTTYFGAIVGRVANRIKGAEFKLKGVQYKLVPNEGKNMLHGGSKGFSDVAWKVSKYVNSGTNPHIVFTYHSKDGEEGFPSELQVTVTYKLLPNNTMSVLMKAKNTGNKATPVSLAQHSYWNLGGHNSGDILAAKLRIFASFYLPVDSELIPTGIKYYARGTEYDFTEPERKAMGLRINRIPSGYDVNYVLDGEKADANLTKAAELLDEKSGILMELSTNAPGVQLYSGDKIKDVKGKDGAVYKAHAGLCLETQWYPDFVNHPDWPQSIVEPGKRYRQYMVYKFSTVS